MNPGREQDYFDLAGNLRPELEAIDGFISVERFRSVSDEGRYVSLSFWRDEAAVTSWREHAAHRIAQAQGKKTIIADFRIRVAEVVRDYTLTDSGS
jgi:heme-degrading monooxygenase HmoA